MIEKTEYGVLIPYEEWEELQEKLNETDSSKVQKLQKENDGLRRTLNTMNSFLSEGDAHV